MDLIDEYHACETSDYIEWGMRATAPPGERMPGSTCAYDSMRGACIVRLVSVRVHICQ